MIEGVKFERDELTKSYLCIIENLSDELKELLRANLSKVCNGISQSESESTVYSYKNTLVEFLKRYEEKTTKIKKGLIGELLAHVLFINYLEDFQSINPFFNLEERSIKKGFDILLYHTKDKLLYYTEVKSGEAGKKNSNSKNISLLGTARSDILNKLQENNDNTWRNAIHGAKIALENKLDLKKITNNILETCLSSAQCGSSSSEDKNVILVSVTYNAISDRIELKRISKYSKRFTKSSNFASTLYFSIQKNTYSRVANFLKDEANNE